MGMTQAERALYQQLSELDNLDDSLELSKAPISRSAGIDASVAGIIGNPIFKSQVDFTFTQNNYNITDDAVVLPTNLPAGLKVAAPFIVFGNSDFRGAFKRSFQLNPVLNPWAVEAFGIFGVDLFKADTYVAKAYASGWLKDGDFVIVYKAIDNAKTYVRFIVLSCPQVAYGTLLDSISSDRFVINMVRYVVSETQTKQLKNGIQLVRQSLFGKTSNDTLSPQTYVTGQTYNKNIADIPLQVGVDKNLVLTSYLDFDVQEINWIVTVASVQKITAR